MVGSTRERGFLTQNFPWINVRGGGSSAWHRWSPVC